MMNQSFVMTNKNTFTYHHIPLENKRYTAETSSEPRKCCMTGITACVQKNLSQ